ncbi:hypothetical protein GZ22_18335 (plasmid) [Terribacillus saccharophilus]|uniref:Uncharacterized protein n=1 Tax=Terribacillus saccharophilus TaxID=361277 RepID=A0A075LNV5_9BACI|nr:hypothetical protein [Terribacillus goriensis]AIF68395.1 hypothetical protein GZ22_18335 [Terribacillus goriensis]
MAKKLYDIPSMENFMKGMENIKFQQLAARELIQAGDKAFEGDTSHYSSGIVTPNGKHNQIDKDGEISFTGTTNLIYLDREDYPPFSAAELLLDAKDDFDIDYAKASDYYNQQKELAMKENENILSSREYRPEHPIAATIKQEMKEVQDMIGSQDESFVSRSEVTALLNLHFDKVSKLLDDFSDRISQAPAKELPQLEEKLEDKVIRIFADLKDGLKQLFTDMKDQARSSVENKVNDVKTGIKNTVLGVKIDIHNAIATPIQNVNNKLKHVTDSLDVRYRIIDKEKALGRAPELVEEKTTTFSKREAEALVKSYMDNHKDLRSEIGGEESLSLRDDKLTMKFRPQQGSGQHIATVDLNSGESRLEFEYQGEHRSEKDYLESFNLHEVREVSQVQQVEVAKVLGVLENSETTVAQGAPEKAQVQSEIVEPAMTEKEATDILKPYIEKLKPEHANLHNDKESVKVKEDVLTMRLFPKESSTNFHEAKVDLKTGEGNLAYHFLDQKNSVSGVNEVDSFNLKELRPASPAQEKVQETPELKKTEFLLTDRKVTPESPEKPVQVKELNDLTKENNGLKTIVNMVRSKHPDVFETIKNELQGVPQPNQAREEPTVVAKKPKVKEESLDL